MYIYIYIYILFIYWKKNRFRLYTKGCSNFWILISNIKFRIYILILKTILLIEAKFEIIRSVILRDMHKKVIQNCNAFRYERTVRVTKSPKRWSHILNGDSNLWRHVPWPPLRISPRPLEKVNYATFVRRWNLNIDLTNKNK